MDGITHPDRNAASEGRRRRVPVIRRSAPPGTAPGSLVGDVRGGEILVRLTGYGPDGLVERPVGAGAAGDAAGEPAGAAPTDGAAAAAIAETLAEVERLQDGHPTVWVDVSGLGDHPTLQTIADAFGLHRLSVEDVVNVPQRAKVETFDDHFFMIARSVRFDPAGLTTEQISLFVGDGWILSFLEGAHDPFDAVRERLRVGRSLIRRGGAGYLAYALIDTVIDGYFPVLETCGERLEAIDERVMQDTDDDVGRDIHTIKRDLLTIRRALVPHREALHGLLRDPEERLNEETRIYLRDAYDHVIQLADMVETYRELAGGLLDVHLATVSNRMNEVMKVLTIFAAIFIPLSFIAGLYGMNFTTDSPWNMPELGLRFGYPLALLLMATVAGGQLLYFRSRGWLGAGRRRRRPSDRE